MGLFDYQVFGGVFFNGFISGFDLIFIGGSLIFIV